MGGRDVGGPSWAEAGGIVAGAVLGDGTGGRGWGGSFVGVGWAALPWGVAGGVWFVGPFFVGPGGLGRVAAVGTPTGVSGRPPRRGSEDWPVPPAVRQAFEDRVRAVRWTGYAASCGNSPHRIPDLLIDMANGDGARAVEAAEDLWDLLCHPHNATPVDVPALPFLLEWLDNATAELAVEILDMLYGFAATVGSLRRYPRSTEPEWVAPLKAGLAAELPRFREWATHANEDAAGYAQNTVEEIEGKSDEKIIAEGVAAEKQLAAFNASRKRSAFAEFCDDIRWLFGRGRGH